MAPHQQRVVDELTDLSERLGKLRTFIGTTVFAGLPLEEQDRLIEQAGHMAGYESVLVRRVAAF